MAESNIYLIGNGAASMEAIKGLRESNFEGQIHLISDSIWPSYNPMLTTYYVAGKIDFEDMFPFGYSMDFYNKYGVNVYFGSKVVELDAENKTIKSAAGQVWNYDKCLVASGASPALPPIMGINSKNVYTMRTIEDAIKLKEALKKNPKKALVVGASMVGIKVVELFDEAGLEVCLADLASCIFPIAAHKECARVIEQKLIKKGIELKLDAGLEGIEETKKGAIAYFTNGESVEADIIVVCVGVKANLDFIDKTQITIDKGILIDDYMRTNDSDVYAAGDVSQGTNLLTGKKEIIGLWTNARYQGRTAGRNIAGANETYKGNTLNNITHFMGMLFTGIGSLNAGDHHEIYNKENSYVYLVWDDDKLVGVNMLGDSCSNIGMVKNALEKSLIVKKYLSKNDLCSENLRNSLLISYFRPK